MMDGNQRSDIASPTRTQQIIDRYRFTFKKSLGQNFLIDRNILRKIASAADLDKRQGVLEIGPGIGALTEQLAHLAGRVAAVEIDQRLIPILKDLFASDSHVSIVQGDVLRMDLAELYSDQFSEVSEVSVVANLPYYITSPIVMKLLESRLPFKHIVVMVQKEVADRMAAKPGGKDYGSLSIAVQYYSAPEIVAVVPNTVFIPKPNVDSAVIRLSRRSEPAVRVHDESLFFDVVQASFAQRRKTLYNNLLSRFFTKENKEDLTVLLQHCDIDPRRRGETLSLDEFARLTNALSDRGMTAYSKP